MKDGFIHTLGRLVGAIIGFVAARAWSLGFGGFLSLFMPIGIARLVAFIIIFVIIARLVGIVFKLADGAFRILSIIPFLKSINSILGAVMGLIEGVIIIGGIIYLILAYLIEPHLVIWIHSSVVAQWIEVAFKALLGFLL